MNNLNIYYNKPTINHIDRSVQNGSVFNNKFQYKFDIINN